MVFAHGRPGIFWDPREPIPPQFRNTQQARRWHDDRRFNVHRLRGVEGLDRWEHPRHDHDQDEDEWAAENVRFRQRRYQADEALGVPNDDNLNSPAMDDGFLPPVSVSIDASITHDTAKVTVNQSFTNNTGSLIPRAGYTFPLPPGSTVVDFSCRIGRDKMLIGKVKPKSEARDTFEEEVAQNRSAGLLQQNSPELFTTTLGNLQPDVQLKATLSFIILLDNPITVEPGKTRATFKLPMHIAPRYGSAPDVVDRLLGRSATATSLSVSVDILAAAEILSITSPTFPNADIQLGATTRQQWIDMAARRPTIDPRSATAKLPAETSCLDRDFVLEILSVSESPVSPFACLETHPEFAGQSALMLTIPPKALMGSPGEYDGGEIIFVADRSGSMDDKMQALKSAMKFFLAGLPVNCSFNIWSFGGRFSSLWPRSRAYNASSRRDAETHISRDFKADLGGTELLNALKRLVASQGAFAKTDIIVLTDGQIWDLEDTIKFVKYTKHHSEGRVRFFSLGIGNAVSHELVEGIAKAGGGYAEVIHTASQGGWEGSVVSLLKAATEKHVFPTSICVKWGRAGEEDELREYSAAELSQSPHDVSKLSPFMMNRVLYLLKHDEYVTPRAVEINYIQPGSASNHMRVPISVLRSPDTTIHKFAARALLGDLERGESGMHAEFNESTPDVAEQVRLKGEALGCMWSLVSKWTSFVAVEVPVPAPGPGGDRAAPEGGGAGRQGRGLNLLRRQGDPSDAVRALRTIEPMEIDSESSDSEDDDSTTEASQGDQGRRDDDGDMGDDGDPSQEAAGPGASEHNNEPGRRGTNQDWNGGDNASDHQHGDESASHSQGPDAGAPTRGVVHKVNIRPAAQEPSLRANDIVNLGAARLFSHSGSHRYGTPLFAADEGSSDEGLTDSRKKVPSRSGVKTKDLYDSLKKPRLKNLSSLRDVWGGITQSAPRPTNSLLGPSTISAPQNNLPASSAIQFSEPLLPTDEIEIGKREIVRLLLPFQDAAGKFVAVNESSTITEVLGADIERFVDTFLSTGGPLHSLPMPEVKSTATLREIARTVSVLQLLRIHFEGSKDLWQLMDTKAVGYLSASFAVTTRTRVMDYAKVNLTRAHFVSPLDLFGNGRRDWAAWGRSLQIPMDSTAKATSPSAPGPERPSFDAQTPESPTEAAGANLPVPELPHPNPVFSFLSQPWSFERPASLGLESSSAGQNVEPGARDGTIAMVNKEALLEAKGNKGDPVTTGGEKEASTSHTALQAEDQKPNILVPPAEAWLADKVAEEDLVRGLAVEREAKDGSGGGREVELPDEI